MFQKRKFCFYVTSKSMGQFSAPFFVFFYRGGKKPTLVTSNGSDLFTGRQHINTPVMKKYVNNLIEEFNI